MLLTVKILGCKLSFGDVRHSEMLIALLMCFPNVETLHIQVSETPFQHVLLFCSLGLLLANILHTWLSLVKDYVAPIRDTDTPYCFISNMLLPLVSLKKMLLPDYRSIYLLIFHPNH
jgi:hypothetical protein